MYSAVRPMKDTLAMIRPTFRTREEGVDGEIVICTEEERFDLISVATAAVWTDTHHSHA
jgi:hypothetical protein